MVESLVRQSGHPQSGFYLHNHAELVKTLCALREANQPTILIGVTFALLDLAEEWGRGELPQWGNLTVMETGGMKGRRRELPREELHQRLCAAFGVEAIHSEYGMTELLSQAYSAGKGKFFTPPWIKIVLRDLHNPFAQAGAGVSGGVNIIDLANQNSCAFIETQDLGRVAPDGSFEILGRIDKSQARGCNMLV
jgi:non-ribosomal peptide synthetase component F